MTNQTTATPTPPAVPTSTASHAKSRSCVHPLHLVMLIAVSAAMTGCRNYRQPCVPQQYTPYNAAPQQYTPYNNGAPNFNGAPGYNPAPNYNFQQPAAGGSGFSTSANSRIPSPATYSINIPGGNNATANANNANGYRVGQLPNGLLNTQQSAPTPANRPANYNQQQGWRQSDGSNLNTSTASPVDANRSAATSVVEPSSGFENPGSNSQGNSGDSILRTASSTSAVGNGVSFTESNDYRTTLTDERLDNSRLPVTDATNVRVTSSLASNQTGSGQYVQPYYEPRQRTQPVNYNQGSFVQPNYQASVPQTYQGNFAQPQNQVLAQSTARYDPYQATASTASGDWRDRGRDSTAY